MGSQSFNAPGRDGDVQGDQRGGVFLFGEGGDAGDVTDGVAAGIQDGGAAAAGGPGGADVEAKVGEGVEAGIISATVFFVPEESIDDSGAEVFSLIKGAAQAEGGVTGADLVVEGQGCGGGIDSEQGGVHFLVVGVDVFDGEDVSLVIDGDEGSFANFEFAGIDDMGAGGEDSVMGDGVSAAEVEVPVVAVITEVGPADAVG